MHFLVLLSALVACAAGVPVNNTKPTQGGRIWGGKPSQIEHHPHQVVLLEQEFPVCGGSIISRTHVLTAAWCISWKSLTFLRVRAGSSTFMIGGSLHRVIGGFVPLQFNTIPWDNDVAVLVVDPPFQYSATVQNIILEDSIVPARTSVVVTGWGETGMTFNPSPVLNEAIVETVDEFECYDPFHWTNNERLICTRTGCENRSPCWGDEGSGLTTVFSQRRLVGIVRGFYGSGGGGGDCGEPPLFSQRRLGGSVRCGFYNCGIGNDIHAYTKVSTWRNWIVATTGSKDIPMGIIKAVGMP